MTHLHLVRRAAVAAAVLALAGGAQAAGFVTNAPIFAPTTELITFDGYDGLVYDATLYPLGLYLDNDGDVLLTTADGGALVGAFAQDLVGNGLWGARFEATPTGSGNFLSATSTLNFNFGADGPQARVGAFFNLSQPIGGPKSNTITLTALDANNVELETVTFSVDTAFDGYNEGVFAGFYRTQADIENFRVSFSGGGSLVMDDLHLSMAPVPEPGTYALMAGGMGLLGWFARRRRAAR
jgi:hypothetical protein